jgi:hypothetical protein
MSARRVGIDVTLGLLGSLTRNDPGAFTSEVHVAGASFIGARYRSVGAYLAPEFGNGGGYRSTMLGGGLSLDLLSLNQIRITALAGYTTFDMTPTDTSASAPTTQSLRGTSVGGMASIPLVGPVRLAYRGQYITGQVNGAAVHVTRYSAGLLLF